MIRRPPRSTLDRSSAASDVYKRQGVYVDDWVGLAQSRLSIIDLSGGSQPIHNEDKTPVSYTHLRAHETVLDLVCRLLLEKKQITELYTATCFHITIQIF